MFFDDEDEEQIHESELEISAEVELNELPTAEEETEEDFGFQDLPKESVAYFLRQSMYDLIE